MWRRSPSAIASVGVGLKATVAVLTDLWPSESEPHSGAFVYEQTLQIEEWFRQVVLVPSLVAPRLHRRVWGDSAQGWQRRRRQLAAPHRVLGYPMLRIPKRGEAAVRALGARAALLRARERPELVHGHFLLHSGAAAVRLGSALGVPVVLTAHGSDVRFLDGGVQVRLRAEMLDACARARRVIAVEEGLAASLVRHGVAAEKIVVVPMGVDAEIFTIGDREEVRRRLGIATQAPIVLFVGRATEAKGAGVLNEALARARSAGEPLEAYAAGPAGGRWNELRALGTLPPPELARWLNAADAVCLPSYAEGMPVSVVQALACGTPVVATPVGGIPTVVRPGLNGMLVPVGDAAALSDALLKATRRIWDRDAIRESSRALWWDAVAPRVADVLRHSLDES